MSLRAPGGLARAGAPALAVAAALAAAACREDAPPALSRAERYGIFRDLVLYRGAPGDVRVFFLDRFETTRADWFSYLEATSGADEPPWGKGRPTAATQYLPVSGVTLAQARRYARWRFCRLPRYEEWHHAATGGGHYEYPWGDLFTPAWANSAELALAAPTPVGTFESGREADGGAYDLVGNVAEWTESIDGSWFVANADAMRPRKFGPRFADRLFLARAAAVLQPWLIGGVPPPAEWGIAVWGADLPRLVAGGHFRAFAEARPGSWPGLLGGPQRFRWERAPPERGDTVGIRLATGPAELMRALLDEPRAPSAAEAAELRAFLRRPATRSVLVPELVRAVTTGAGPLLAVLQQELGG